jgi:hypothetical protein
MLLPHDRVAILMSFALFALAIGFPERPRGSGYRPARQDRSDGLEQRNTVLGRSEAAGEAHARPGESSCRRPPRNRVPSPDPCWVPPWPTLVVTPQRYVNTTRRSVLAQYPASGRHYKFSGNLCGRRATNFIGQRAPTPGTVIHSTVSMRGPVPGRPDPHGDEAAVGVGSTGRPSALPTCAPDSAGSLEPGRAQLPKRSGGWDRVAPDSQAGRHGAPPCDQRR